MKYNFFFFFFVRKCSVVEAETIVGRVDFDKLSYLRMSLNFYL